MRSILMRVCAMLIAFVVVTTALLPDYGFAQGRGHGRGLSKKSEKFVNGHDARDGRWDGRGPRPRLFRSASGHHHHGRHLGWMKRR